MNSATNPLKEPEPSIDDLTHRAEAGEAKAQYELGILYRYGMAGLREDATEAFKWFNRAAEQGCSKALWQLALMYEDGEGVRKNQKKALQSCRQAFQLALESANVGDAEGAFLVGKAYRDGHGVKEDEAKAIEWLTKSANKGWTAAETALGEFYMHRGDNAESAKWYRRSAEKGDAEAQYQLASLYHDGIGVPKDDEEAFKWYLRAAEQENRDAYWKVASSYEQGQGVAQNGEEALKWYLKDAGIEHHGKYGSGHAQFCLGIMYAAGQAIGQDLVQAYKWLNLAAANRKEEAAEGRDLLAQKMTREQVAEAQRRTTDFLRQVELTRKNE